MMLILHILIALSSLALATFAYFRPSLAALRGSYALVLGTLTTGTYLVVINPAHMVTACTSGLIYLAVVSTAILAARRKLAAETL